MKNSAWRIGISVMALVFGIMLAGCPAEPADEPATYEIWVATFKFASDDRSFGTMQDGQYRCFELTEDEFNWELSNNFENKANYVWTEDQIYSYLIGKGFGRSQAREEAGWLASIRHGIIGYRDETALHMILK